MRPPPAPLEIRFAGPADAGPLVPLLSQLGYPTDEATIAERLLRLTTEGDEALVAVRGEAILGLATVHATPVLHRPAPVGRVTALVVAEGARGQGVGRALMDAAERRLRGRGCVMVEVTSNRARTDAHAFYERLGYVATSFRFAKTLEPG